jgi:transposase InsO family protein
VRRWKDKTGTPGRDIIRWIGIQPGKYFTWKNRYGKVNEHNSWIPRDHWLTESEKQSIIKFHFDYPLEGYRRLTYLMLDADGVAGSSASVYRVLKAADLIGRNKNKPSKKGTGFRQPSAAHHHWHIDISYINLAGTFYYMCSVLDGYSRFIVHWDIREQMTEADVEVILQRAKEKFPNARPRIISDNGPQFIAKDFKQFIRISGMTHVRTSPYYPQSNGKLERYHRTIKADCIRPGTPLTLEDVKKLVASFVENYNEKRLHSAIGYVAPADKLHGREEAIFAERDAKLEAAREARKQAREEKFNQAKQARGQQKDILENACYTENAWSEDRALQGCNPSAVPSPEAKLEATAVASIS